MVKFFVAGIGVALLLGACGQTPSPQQACASYGYAPGTAAFAQCAERADRAEAARRQQALRNANAYLTPPTFNFPQQRQCQWIGNIWTCQ